MYSCVATAAIVVLKRISDTTGGLYRGVLYIYPRVYTGLSVVCVCKGGYCHSGAVFFIAGQPCCNPPCAKKPYWTGFQRVSKTA